MVKLPGGPELVKEYYRVAPVIIERINELSTEDKRKVYQQIWTEYLKPCLKAIEYGDSETGFSTYIMLMRDLYDRYLSS